MPSGMEELDESGLKTSSHVSDHPTVWRTEVRKKRPSQPQCIPPGCTGDPKVSQKQVRWELILNHTRRLVLL